MKIWNCLTPRFTSLVLELGLIKCCNICTAVKKEHKSIPEYCEIYTLSRGSGYFYDAVALNITFVKMGHLFFICFAFCFLLCASSRV